jgi:hypothetical protein
MEAAVPPLRIAILNDGEDTITTLSEWFQVHGHVPLALRAKDVRKELSNPADAVAALKADVLVYDVGIPYAVNWYYAELLRLALPGLPMVLTTANRDALHEIVGANSTFELTATSRNLTALLGLVYACCGRTADGQVPPTAK